MKKLLFSLLFSIIGIGFCCAQTPGKLTVSTSFWGGYSYSISDQKTKTNDVQLHLNKYDTDAAYWFKRSRANDRNGTIWSIVGIGGVLGALLADDPGTSLALATVGVVGTSGAVVCVVLQNNNSKKARQHYNIKYGY